MTAMPVLNREIDTTDDEIERLRGPLNEAQSRKDRAVDRQLIVSNSIDMLQAVIDGRTATEILGTEAA